MKYYINGRFLTQRITGVQRYAREMTLALDQLLQEKPSDHSEYTILAPKNIIDRLPCKRIQFKVCGHLSGHLWEQIELPYYAKDGYLLNFCNCAPLIKKNQAVTIHDAAIAAFPSAYSWKFRLWYRILYTVLGKRLNTIFTVSNFSRSELNKYFGIPKEKIHVTYNGVEHLKAIQPDDRILAKIPKDYVLAVSSQNPTKNFKLVLEAAEQLPDIYFVIAGGSNAKVFNGKDKRALPNVQYVGYVSDQELVSLYRHAMVFVYPSLYEGFGIPPLEALLNGCPVIVSNQASLPEICGDRVDYCNLKNTKSLVSKIIDIALKKKPAIQHLEKQIQERYSWKKSSAYLYAYYNDNRSK